jgi:hypothetical protein
MLLGSAQSVNRRPTTRGLVGSFNRQTLKGGKRIRTILHKQNERGSSMFGGVAIVGSSCYQPVGVVSDDRDVIADPGRNYSNWADLDVSRKLS